MREIAGERHGIEMTFTDMTDYGIFEKLIQPNTKLIFLETPTNPNLKTGDI